MKRLGGLIVWQTFVNVCHTTCGHKQAHLCIVFPTYGKIVEPNTRFMYNAIRNSVRLLGRLGQDPEVKQTGKGNKVAKCSLATSESYKTSDGEKISDTTWHNLVIWGKQAEIAERLMSKGAEVVVEGRISNRSFLDKDGNKRFITEIIVNDFVLLSRKEA